MSTPPSRAGIVAAIVGRDLRSFATDTRWLVLTPLSLLTVVVGFWLAPGSVDDSIHVGVCPPSALALMQRVQAEDAEEDEGVILVGAGAAASRVCGRGP